MFIDVAKEKSDAYIVDRPGRHLFFIYNHSGKVNVEVASPGAEVAIYGLFSGNKNDVFELNTIQRHIGGDNSSELFIRGVFTGKSRFHHEGLIRIEKEAQRASAYQKNQSIVLSEDCFVDSRPFLEILANDVRCTHGSTTGGLNEEELHYLATRGVPRVAATELVLAGFMKEVFRKARAFGFEREMAPYSSLLPK